MSTSVKSDKTFDEIVERLAVLFKLKPRSDERNYEVSLENPSHPPARRPPASAVDFRSSKK